MQLATWSRAPYQGDQYSTPRNPNVNNWQVMRELSFPKIYPDVLLAQPGQDWVVGQFDCGGA
jgi:hypothetical protein